MSFGGGIEQLGMEDCNGFNREEASRSRKL